MLHTLATNNYDDYEAAYNLLNEAQSLLNTIRVEEYINNYANRINKAHSTLESKRDEIIAKERLQKAEEERIKNEE